MLYAWPAAASSPASRAWGLSRQDGGDDVLIARVAGQAHDGHVLDLGHGAHGRLDLGGVDVEAPRDDELLAAVGDDVEAVVLLAHQVPGAQPAAGQQDRLGLLQVRYASGCRAGAAAFPETPETEKAGSPSKKTLNHKLKESFIHSATSIP